MLFRGTRRRDAASISREIERVGGSFDAFTTRDTMCLYAHVLESNRELAFDLLGDMLTGSTFSPALVDVEKNVVLEEIRDARDAPDDYVHEIFGAELFPSHPYGRSILGTRERVSTFVRRDVRRFATSVLRAPNLVVAVYGNVTMHEVRRLCDEYLRLSPRAAPPRRNVPVHPGFARRHVRRRLGQQYICIGIPTFSWNDPRRDALTLLTNIVGGGMSSRLFRHVRDDLGLAYTVYSYADHSRDAGMMGTFLSVRPSNTGHAIEVTLEELARLRGEGIPSRELEDIRGHVKGRILLGLETSTSRMMRMAWGELRHGRQVTERELIRRLDDVTLDDVNALACEYLDSDRQTIVSLGPSSAGLRGMGVTAGAGVRRRRERAD